MLSIKLRKVPEEQKTVVRKLAEKKAPAGAETAMAVWRNEKRFCVLYRNKVRFLEMRVFSRD